jgi:WD40 repeat protein
MRALVLSLLLLSLQSVAKDISPLFTLEASGLVSDFVVEGTTLYAATDRGSIDIFDLIERKVIGSILLDPIPTAQGDTVPARIYSVDRHKGATLILSRGRGGYRDLWLHDGLEVKKVKADSKLFAKKARFTQTGDIFLGTFGSDIMLYDTREGFPVYRQHISESTLGGIALSDDKRKAILSDESGAVRVVDIASSRIEHLLDAEHVDNIYRVAYRKGIILTAGQDRRVGVYDLEHNRSYHINSDFLVYCVALSPDGKTGIYSSGVDHDLQLFDIATRAKGDRLVGHHATVNKILFLDDSLLISAGDERKIYIWKLSK